MKWLNVIILEIDFDEGFPVVVALMDFDVVEHIAGKIKVFGDGQIFQHFADIDAIVFKQQAVPAIQFGLRQIQARRFAEMRRTDQFTLEVIGPAMQRANDILGMAAT